MGGDGSVVLRVECVERFRNSTAEDIIDSLTLTVHRIAVMSETGTSAVSLGFRV